jgi:UDPglucose--hexose-1-phosphate uridylyltransferase
MHSGPRSPPSPLDLRLNPLTGVPVVVAPGRSARPGALGRTTRIADAATCPFCEGHEGMTPPEVLALGRGNGAADTPGWTVRVVPNKFPAIPGQEVVVHGPAHVTAFAELSEAVVAEALRAWGRRREHHRELGAAYLLTAINEGPAAGASLDHSHSQLVPFDHIPPAVADEMPGFAAPCALCTAVADEETRTIRLEDGLRTFAPRWSRFAYELWIVPEEHSGDVAAPELLAPALLDATRRLRAALGAGLAWNAVLHAPPLRGDDPYHWHIEIWPRVAVAASVELGAGIWVNIVDPDVAAGELRSVKP